jgi:uncharacterized protein (DUF433 family)
MTSASSAIAGPGMRHHPRITADPALCGGRAVIRGTRIEVALVVGSLAGGMGFDEVAREYDLSQDDIHAALAYASERVAGESRYPLGHPNASP